MGRDIHINMRGHEVRALLDGRKTQARRVLRASVPEMTEARCHPKHTHLHPAPYLDSYCSEPKTLLNPRGMSQNWCWWQVDDRQCLPTFKVPFLPGDRLWVRENWQTGMTGDGPRIAYAATPDDVAIDAWDGPNEGRGPSFNYDRCPGAKWHHWLGDVLGNDGPWRPSSQMQRWASRLTLIVESVKVERLQDISEADAMAEGIEERWSEGVLGWRIYEDEGEVPYPRTTGHPRNSFRSLWDSINGADAWEANPFVVALTFSVHRSNIDALMQEAA